MPGTTSPPEGAPADRTGRVGGLAWIAGGVLAFALAAALVLLVLSSALSPDPTPSASADRSTRASSFASTSAHASARPSDAGAPNAGAPSAAATPEGTDGFSVWAVNDDGTPIRWDPCRPIEVVLSPTGAPRSAAADLDEALARLASASGLELVRTATTDERPSGSRRPYQPGRYGQRWAPILVAWAAPGESGLPLRETDRGVAIPVAGGPEGDRTFLTAQVVLNRDRTDLVAGFGDRADAWGATLLHELLHALGLAHVEDPSQLMAVYPGSGPVVLGAGDLAGIAAIGATHGCRPAPTPGPVQVAPPPPSLPGRP